MGFGIVRYCCFAKARGSCGGRFLDALFIDGFINHGVEVGWSGEVGVRVRDVDVRDGEGRDCI